MTKNLSIIKVKIWLYSKLDFGITFYLPSYKCILKKNYYYYLRIQFKKRKENVMGK